MLKAIIVDDEPHIVQGLKALIDWKSEGYNIVASFSNGKEALEYLKNNKVDLIMADIKMPVMTGLDLLKEIRDSKVSDAAFVISSGFADFSYAQTAIKYDCKRYILKPVDAEALLEILREVKEENHAEDKIPVSKEMEDAYFERNLIGVIKGKYDDVILERVLDKIRNDDEIRYIEIQAEDNNQIDEEDDDSEKLAMQRKIYEAAKVFLGENEYNAVLDPSGHDKIFDVGFIFTRDLAGKMGISEEAYFDKLHDYLSDYAGVNVILFVGKKVKGLKNTSKSYGTACRLRYLKGFREKQSIYKYDDNDIKDNNDRVFILKDSIDNFIRSVEDNNKDRILETIEKLFEDMMESGTGSFIDININYIVFQLINLAAKQDDDINQEEILRIISEKTFENGILRGSKEHLKQFALEYADYLSQLRKNVSKGALADVEREIKYNYMSNLTLKGLGDKYYINSAYLGQIFHKKYGCSFKDYLNNYRLDKAVELLLNTDMKIYEIASSVGYRDVDYFVNKFIALKGCTPAKFRKQEKGNI
jgi:two-component system response regulator YesN